MNANFYNILQSATFTVVTSDHKVHFKVHLRLLRSNLKPSSTLFCSRHRSLESNLTKYILKTPKGIEKQLKSTFTIFWGSAHCSGVRSDQKIHFETFKAVDKRLKFKLYKFLQHPPFTVVTSDQKVHFNRTIKATENQMNAKFYNILQSATITVVTSDHKVHFKVI